LNHFVIKLYKIKFMGNEVYFPKLEAYKVSRANRETDRIGRFLYFIHIF